MKLPGTKAPGAAPVAYADALTGWAFLVTLMTSVTAYVCLAVIAGRSAFALSPLLSLPFVVAGVSEYIRRRRWPDAAVVLVVSAALAVSAPAWMPFAVYATVGAEGVAVVAGLLQRMSFIKVLDGLSSPPSVSGPSATGRFLRFIFGVPADEDLRDVRMDGYIRKDGFPWNRVSVSMVLALVPCAVVWVCMAMSPAFSGKVPGATLSLLTVSMYIVAAAAPFTMFDSLDVRMGSGSRVYRPAEGLVGTFLKMDVSVLILMAAIVIMAPCGRFQLVYVGLSALLTFGMASLVTLIHGVRHETSLATDLLEAWRSFRPVDMYCRRDGGIAASVPGTPSRDAESCFREVGHR